jgi:hypothetical protein
MPSLLGVRSGLGSPKHPKDPPVRWGERKDGKVPTRKLDPVVKIKGAEHGEQKGQAPADSHSSGPAETHGGDEGHSHSRKRKRGE